MQQLNNNPPPYSTQDDVPISNFKNRIKQLLKIMPSKTIVGLAIFLIMAIGGVSAFVLTKISQDVRQQASTSCPAGSSSYGTAMRCATSCANDCVGPDSKCCTLSIPPTPKPTKPPVSCPSGSSNYGSTMRCATSCANDCIGPNSQCCTLSIPPTPKPTKPPASCPAGSSSYGTAMRCATACANDCVGPDSKCCTLTPTAAPQPTQSPVSCPSGSSNYGSSMRCATACANDCVGPNSQCCAAIGGNPAPTDPPVSCPSGSSNYGSSMRCATACANDCIGPNSQCCTFTPTAAPQPTNPPSVSCPSGSSNYGSTMRCATSCANDCVGPNSQCCALTPAATPQPTQSPVSCPSGSSNYGSSMRCATSCANDCVGPNSQCCTLTPAKAPISIAAGSTTTLKRGESCGDNTAKCGSGLRCYEGACRIHTEIRNIEEIKRLFSEYAAGANNIDDIKEKCLERHNINPTVTPIEQCRDDKSAIAAVFGGAVTLEIEAYRSDRIVEKLLSNDDEWAEKVASLSWGEKAVIGTFSIFQSVFGDSSSGYVNDYRNNDYATFGEEGFWDYNNGWSSSIELGGKIGSTIALTATGVGAVTTLAGATTVTAIGVGALNTTAGVIALGSTGLGVAGFSNALSGVGATCVTAQDFENNPNCSRAVTQAKTALGQVIISAFAPGVSQFSSAGQATFRIAQTGLGVVNTSLASQNATDICEQDPESTACKIAWANAGFAGASTLAQGVLPAIKNPKFSIGNTTINAEKAIDLALAISGGGLDAQAALNDCILTGGDPLACSIAIGQLITGIAQDTSQIRNAKLASNALALGSRAIDDATTLRTSDAIESIKNQDLVDSATSKLGDIIDSDIDLIKIADLPDLEQTKALGGLGEDTKITDDSPVDSITKTTETGSDISDVIKLAAEIPKDTTTKLTDVDQTSTKQTENIKNTDADVEKLVDTTSEKNTPDNILLKDDLADTTKKIADTSPVLKDTEGGIGESIKKFSDNIKAQGGVVEAIKNVFSRSDNNTTKLADIDQASVKQAESSKTIESDNTLLGDGLANTAKKSILAEPIKRVQEILTGSPKKEKLRKVVIAETIDSYTNKHVDDVTKLSSDLRNNQESEIIKLEQDLADAKKNTDTEKNQKLIDEIQKDITKLNSDLIDIPKKVEEARAKAETAAKLFKKPADYIDSNGDKQNGSMIDRISDIYKDIDKSIFSKKVPDALINEITELALLQQIDNPEQYVSHGFDHTLTVLRDSEVILNKNPEIVKAIRKKYGVNATQAKMLATTVALFHDFGYPGSAGKGKAVHALASADIVSSKKITDIHTEMFGKNIFGTNKNIDLILTDIREAVLLHNADKVEKFYDTKITTSEGSYLMDAKNFLDVAKVFDETSGELPRKIKEITVSTEAEKIQIEALIEKTKDNSIFLNDEGIYEPPIIRISDDGEKFGGRGMDLDTKDDGLIGTEFTVVDAIDDPLYAIIRLADNMDITKNRISDIQKQQAFSDILMELGDTRGDSAKNTQLTEEASKAFKNAKEGEIGIAQQKFEKAKTRILEQLLGNETIYNKFETIGDAKTLESSWREYLVDGVLQGKKYVNLDPKIKEDIRRIGLQSNSESLRHFAGGDSVLKVELIGSELVITIDEKTYSELNTIRVDEKTLEINDDNIIKTVLKNVGVGEYQIWRLEEAYSSLKLDGEQINVKLINENGDALNDKGIKIESDDTLFGDGLGNAVKELLPLARTKVASPLKEIGPNIFRGFIKPFTATADSLRKNLTYLLQALSPP